MVFCNGLHSFHREVSVMRGKSYIYLCEYRDFCIKQLGIMLVQERGGSGFSSKSHDIISPGYLAKFPIVSVIFLLFIGPYGYCQDMNATVTPLGISHCVDCCGSQVPQQGRPNHFFSLENFIPLSGSMKATPQARRFQVISNSYLLSPMSKECGFISNRALLLTSEKQPKASPIANIIQGVS